MNREKLLEIANAIENSPPENFHMGSWFGEEIRAVESETWWQLEEIGIHEDQQVNQGLAGLVNMFDIVDVARDTVKISCDTTACVAGWAVANEFFNGRYKEHRREYLESLRPSDVEPMAREILDLTPNEASQLFYLNRLSVWQRYAPEYQYGKDLPEGIDLEEVPELWNIHPKEAADVLRRVANGEIKLGIEWSEIDYE
jgi:hypothetical protein